jgi:Do/DeqQ family serine protease
MTIRRLLWVLAVLPAALPAAGQAPSEQAQLSAPPATARPAAAEAPLVAQAVPSGRGEIVLSFAPVVRRASPAVVNIYAATRSRQQAQRPPFADDPFFRRFFGEDFLRSLPRERVQNALGSGVVVRGNGLVVTNAHVVKGSDEIRVVMHDRREFDATVRIVDERYDLAVLKIEVGGEALPALELRDSDTIEAGDIVLAIGNPFGLSQTVTSGIVSAVARVATGVNESGFFIQTDAAINPGNSGGALVGLDGRLVGINTAIYAARGGGSIGIGFATPSNIVARLIDVVDDGAARLVRPWLGAAVQNLTAEIAASLGIGRPAGVIVRSLVQGGPAERAGIRVGDAIVAVGSVPIDDENALRFRLATQRMGQTVELAIRRNGQDSRLAVSLVPPPETPARDQAVLADGSPLSGAVVVNMSPAVAEELGLDEAISGVVVTELRQGFGRRFLKAGDQIVSVNGRTVGSVAELRRVVGSSSGDWTLAVRRDGQVQNFRFRG